MREVIILNPWRFRKNEEVELYWLCSPYYNDEHNWMVKAVFKRNDGSLKEIEYPWGNLQLLRYGCMYKNGRKLDDVKSCITQEVFVPETYIYEILNAFKMPKRLYSMYENYEYGNQKVCHFYVKGMNYYIPCIEIVRSLLTPSKTLTNYIMRPHGLDMLIDNTEVIGNTLYINFNSDYPSRMVNDESVYHFIWLKYNKLANNTWNSVYNDIFKTAAGASSIEPIANMKKGTFLEVKPPINKDCRWVFSGIANGNSTLILELLGIQGLDMPPYDKVFYSHPSLFNPEPVDEPKTRRNAVKEREKPDEYELDDSEESSAKDTDQVAIDVPATMFGFNRKPKMIKNRKRTQKLRTGDTDEERLGIGEKMVGEENLVTTQDWALDGEIQPIEFKALEVVKEDPKRGLEKFFKVVGYIENHYRSFGLALTVVYLPFMNTFSVCPDGYRRTCAIVKVSHEGQAPCYIIEIGRPDDWSVSTLFIRPIDTLDIEAFEIIFKDILNQLVENNGHWDHDFLQQFISFNYDIAKHTSAQTIARWGERLVEKIK